MDDNLFPILGLGLGVGFMIIGLLIPTLFLLVGTQNLRAGLSDAQPSPKLTKSSFYPILWP